MNADQHSPFQLHGALSGGWDAYLRHEQVAKRIANVRFTAGREDGLRMSALWIKREYLINECAF